MLKKISVGNFLSFNEYTILNFEKSNYKFLEDKNTFNKLTKGSFFIGGNASGKTNAIKAIRLLLDLLFSGNNINVDNYACQFSDSNDMRLHYEFLIGDSIVTYEIIRDVIEKTFNETLYVNGERIIDRIDDNARYYNNSSVGNDFFNEIDRDSLFVREVYFSTKFRGNNVLFDWMEFLRNSIYVNPGFRNVKSYNNSILTLDKYLDENGTDQINATLEKLLGEIEIEYTKTCQGKKNTFVSDDRTVFIRRKRITEPMPLELESEGTINLLNILPSFLHVINNNGMLIIDEFSSAFHNFLERLLVKFFYNHSQQSQLFLVTHATNLLNSEILRPDQVFTFSFNDNTGTHVIKVSEYAQPRSTQNFEKMYLSGMFEGVPLYE